MENLILKNIDIWTTAQMPKNGTGRSNGFANQSLYGIKKLREVILELAVRGKLVPQDPKDEPASVLLEKIAQERARLIKEGKIKKEKPLPDISEDEKPYKLPIGWGWSRLADLYYSISPSGKKLKSSEILENGEFPVVDQGKSYIAGFTDDASLLIKIPGPVVVFGDHTTERKYIDFSFVAGADGTKILRPYKMDEKYFYTYLLSYKLENRGYARHFQVLNNNLFALPPLAEQHRIVAKVDELMALCDPLEQQQTDNNAIHQTLVETLLSTLTASTNPGEFSKTWQCIAEHFDTLFTTEQSIDQLQQTILQLAVMGKLVPQDPKDEPASVLLEKIAKEKARLIKEGKIKKEKPLPEITENEKPFELPQGWAWTRLGIVSLINPRNNAEDDSIASFIPMTFITTSHTGEHDQEDCLWGSIKQGFTHFADGDIGLAKITPCFENSKAAVFSNLKNGIGAGTTELHIARPIGETLCARYGLLYLKSPHFLLLGSTKMTGTAGQKRVPKDFFAGNPFPLPPLSEQHRIVAKVDELMALCDALKAGLKEAQTTQIQLADAVVEQAVA